MLALPALPLTLWAALALIGQVQERTQRLHAGSLICGAAALHSLLWIGLNANRAFAEARYTRVMQESPLSAYARSYGWETLGTYYRDRKQTEQALRAYERAVEAAPENPRLWNLIGLLYADLNRPGDALRAFQRSLQIDPGLADTHNNTGNVYFRLGQQERAIDHFRKAIALRPDFAEPYNNMGNACFRLGRYETAIAHYQKALSLKPGLTQAYNNLKKAYSRLGQPEKQPALDIQEPTP